MKKFLAVAAIVAGSVLIPVSAAQAYGEVSGPTTASPGSVYTYTIADLPTNADVTLSVNGPGDATIVGLVTSAPKTPTGSGPYSVSFDISFPATGDYTLSATQPGNTIASVTVSVVAVPADTIAVTGTDAAPFLWFGGGLVALGGGLVAMLAVLRRNKAASAT